MGVGWRLGRSGGWCCRGSTKRLLPLIGGCGGGARLDALRDDGW